MIMVWVCRGSGCGRRARQLAAPSRTVVQSSYHHKSKQQQSEESQIAKSKPSNLGTRTAWAQELKTLCQPSRIMLLVQGLGFGI